MRTKTEHSLALALIPVLDRSGSAVMEDGMQQDQSTTRLLDAIKGIDLTSADGRAGIGSILAEIERRSPGLILQQAARIQLRSLGLPTTG